MRLGSHTLARAFDYRSGPESPTSCTLIVASFTTKPGARHGSTFARAWWVERGEIRSARRPSATFLIDCPRLPKG